MARGKEFIQSSGLILLGNYTNVFLAIGISIILSRLLEPSDFGIMAIIAVILGLIQVIGNSGVSIALIQFGSKMNKERISGLLLVISIASVFLAIAQYLCSNFIEIWLGYNEISTYLKILSPLVFFTILSGALKALLISNRNFKQVAIGSVLATFLSGFVGVSMAYYGYGVMALIYKSILYQIMLFLIYVLANKNNFSVALNFQFPKEFSSYLLNGVYSQVTNFLMRNLDTLLIGKFLGDVALGLYDVSYKIMRQPVSNIAKVFTPVMQPLFRTYELETLYSSYTRIARLMGIIGFIISIPFVIWGDDIFSWIYGEKWLAGAPIFKILSISIFFHLLLSGAGGVMLAKGYQRILSKSMTYSFISMIGCILLGVFLGDLLLVAWFYVLSVIINFFQSFYLLFKYVFKNVNLFFFRNEFVFGLVVFYMMLYISYFLILNLRVIAANTFITDMLFSVICAFGIFYFGIKYHFLKELKYIWSNLKGQ